MPNPAPNHAASLSVGRLPRRRLIPSELSADGGCHLLESWKCPSPDLAPSACNCNEDAPSSRYFGCPFRSRLRSLLLSVVAFTTLADLPSSTPQFVSLPNPGICRDGTFFPGPNCVCFILDIQPSPIPSHWYRTHPTRLASLLLSSILEGAV